MCALLSTSSLFCWRFHKVDVKSAFLQARHGQRNVYVVPPRDSLDRRKFLSLLLTVAYSLANANAKWQVLPDELLRNICFTPSPLIPQLFLMFHDYRVVANISKIFDDVLLSGLDHPMENIIQQINDSFTFVIVVHGPVPLRFFGLNIL